MWLFVAGHARNTLLCMRQWRVRIGDWSVAVSAASRRDAVIAAVERAVRQHRAGLGRLASGSTSRRSDGFARGQRAVWVAVPEGQRADRPSVLLGGAGDEPVARWREDITFEGLADYGLEDLHS